LRTLLFHDQRKPRRKRMIIAGLKALERRVELTRRKRCVRRNDRGVILVDAQPAEPREFLLLVGRYGRPLHRQLSLGRPAVDREQSCDGQP
jgi:hypothetical protein